MRPVRAIGALAALALAVAAGGCGGSDSSGSLDPKVGKAYVDAQASALCLVQSNAYKTQAEQAAAFKKELKSASKLSADELAEAQAAAAKDVDLRAQISDKVDSLCG